jgi:methyl-accepting chemotaxis protein
MDVADQGMNQERDMSDNRRRRLIIEGNFQARFILRFILVIVGATLLSTGAILGLFYFKYQAGGAELNSLIIVITPEGETTVAGLFQVILTPIIGANLLVLCIVIPYSLVYSHKVAGPIYRLEQSMEMLLNGDMDFVITLRKNDEFKYLADRMNAIIDYMRRNISEVRSSHRIIRDIVERIHRLMKKEPVNMELLTKEVVDLERFFKERGKPFSY